MRLLMDEPNVLLLDEPTNDLDIDTLTALEDLLDGWPGSLVVVSHDRFFLERTCDDLHGLLGDGRIRHLPGGVEEYLGLRRDAHPAPSSPSSAVQASRGPDPARRGAAVRQARKEVQRLERELDRLERRAVALHEAMAAHATDYGRVATLDEELRSVAAERARLEEAWLEAAEGADG
jgi:ATP-binding cassette subfamily F protein uup